MIKKIINYIISLYKRRKCNHKFRMDYSTHNKVTDEYFYQFKCKYCGEVQTVKWRY